MPEVMLPFPRAFVEFADPGDGDTVFRCDLTWLTSRWTCIFGRAARASTPTGPTTAAARSARTSPTPTTRSGSRKAVAPAERRPVAVQEGRRRRAAGSSWRTPTPWPRARSPARKTRVVDGACIFLNRPGFAGRRRAARCTCWPSTRDASFVETKPDVCWQLPLRRQFRTVTRSRRDDLHRGDHRRVRPRRLGSRAGTTSTGTAPPTPRPTTAAARSTWPTATSWSR